MNRPAPVGAAHGWCSHWTLLLLLRVFMMDLTFILDTRRYERTGKRRPFGGGRTGLILDRRVWL